MTEPAKDNATASSSESSSSGAVSVTAEEYQRLRSLESQFKELQRQQEAAIEAKEAERLRALAEKGNVEEALAQQRASWERKHAEAQARYADLERQVFEDRKAAAIAEAFQGRSFAGETAEQRADTAAMARQLLRDELETVRDASGSLSVRDKVTGRPAAEVIAERLDSPRFAIFFAPSARGGAGTDGARSFSSPAPAKPGSLEAIARQWKDQRDQYQSFGLHPMV